MLAWLCYVIVSLVWGSTYLAIALGLESFTPYGMVALRFGSAGLVALLIARLRREPLPMKADLLPLMLTGALMLSGSNTLVTWSEQHVSSGVAAIVCALVPVFLTLFARERLGLRALTGLTLGFAGVAVLMNPGGGHLHLGGIGALLMADLLWAFGTLHAKHHVKGGGAFGNIAMQMLTAAAVALVGAPLTGGFTHGPVTAKALGAVAYLSIFGSLLAFSAYVHLSRAWTPAKMGTYAYLNPLVAVLLGGLVLSEPFSLRMAAGMAVILAGVALVQLRPSPKREIAATPLAESV
ncbi:MAG TPA: EamA family transporter [Holophagaceae bacterium]|nr:EamA family transporter [Holophagaceae bacterium]